MHLTNEGECARGKNENELSQTKFTKLNPKKNYVYETEESLAAICEKSQMNTVKNFSSCEMKTKNKGNRISVIEGKVLRLEQELRLFRSYLKDYPSYNPMIHTNIKKEKCWSTQNTKSNLEEISDFKLRGKKSAKLSTTYSSSHEDRHAPLIAKQMRRKARFDKVKDLCDLKPLNQSRSRSRSRSRSTSPLSKKMNIGSSSEEISPGFLMSLATYQRLYESTLNELGGVDKIISRSDIRGNKEGLNGTNTLFGMTRSNCVNNMIQEAQIKRSDLFLDVGSGIGSVCIQIAAMVGCPAIGVESVEARHNLAVESRDIFLEKFKKEFSHDLNIVFHHADIFDDHYQSLFRDASVIFLCNGGGWMDGLRDRTVHETFHMKFIDLVCRNERLFRGSQTVKIITLETLNFTKGSYTCRTFDSGPNAFSWIKNSIKIFLYELKEPFWICPQCNQKYNHSTTFCSFCQARQRSTRL